MKRELSIKNRLLIPAILPEKGDLVTMTVAEDIKNKIKLTQEDFRDTGFRSDENGCRWEKEKAVSYDFTEAETDLIRAGLREKDEKKEITAELLNLYSAFK